MADGLRARLGKWLLGDRFYRDVCPGCEARDRHINDLIRERESLMGILHPIEPYGALGIDKESQNVKEFKPVGKSRPWHMVRRDLEARHQKHRPNTVPADQTAEYWKKKNEETEKQLAGVLNKTEPVKEG